MHRFYIPRPQISRNKLVISDPGQLHHIRDVLRNGPGDKIILFDAKGSQFTGVIAGIGQDSIEVDIKARRNPVAAAGLKLTLACAIPKGKTMDGIIDKLTQLGVERIIPMQTQRVIVSWNEDKKSRHLERWTKIAQNSCEQSGRSRLVEIEAVKNISEILAEEKDYDLKLIPALCGRRRSLKKILRNNKPKKIIILIGPEGDFTAREVERARRSGFRPVTLGDTVLRVETAAVAAASFIKLFFEK